MRYGLIGGKLGHSYSREIHAAIADYAYDLRELTPEEVAPFFRTREFAGVNVTIPYKETVIPLLDEISEDARRVGAVNTVVNRGGRLFGDNTDLAGMRAMLSFGGISLAGKKVLILGTGGTGKTARAVATAAGAGQVVAVSRSGKDGTVTYAEATARHADAQVLINTTPVGMYPACDGQPLSLAAFPQLCGVADVIYNPLRTRLLQEAAERGIPAVGGLYMLAAQAVYASALFRGIPADTALVQKAYRAVLRQKQNALLVGMPSSGKSTVGRLLAAALGKTFTDTDSLVEERLGMPISKCFAEKGEDFFRQIEAQTVAEVAKSGGQVIATGGGTVKDPENVRALRQNGVFFFLDRSPALLTATADRPLSATPEAMAQLYRTRLPLYRTVADCTVQADGTPEQVVQQILQEWKI